MQEQDAINYNLGKYIAIAFHDPKKYPRRPFLYKEQVSDKPMSVDEMIRVARLNTERLGGTIK